MEAKKVLIVEDKKNIRDSLEMDLSNLNYEVASASTGESALDLYSSFKPDIVFMDIRLAGELDDGIKVAGYMLSIRKCCLIYLTGNPGYSNQIKKYPHHAFINKPYGADFLPDHIKIAWSKFTAEQSDKARTITITYNHAENGRQTEVINADELILIENVSLKKHLKLTFKSGEVKQGGTYSNFSDFLLELNHPNFVQVSSGMAVNLAHNPTMRANQVIFEGIEHDIVSISRNFKANLVTRIQNK